ncbi:MAG: hypothetical protein BWY17_05392 [Deltaproteobacteria bacterium ADurb.Bin207]|nr:MAG: hypothetical protein BWY17_05392 [Deltaproteobacteria bacterium ADurb.Bin207]
MVGAEMLRRRPGSKPIVRLVPGQYPVVAAPRRKRNMSPVAIRAVRIPLFNKVQQIAVQAVCGIRRNVPNFVIIPFGVAPIQPVELVFRMVV